MSKTVTRRSRGDSHQLAHRFFENITVQRNLAEAERVLSLLEKSLDNGEWARGYLQALEGMLLSIRSGDRLALIHNLSEMDDKRIKRLIKEFSNGFRPPIGDEFDEGFFSAWTDFLRFLQKAKAR